MALGTHKRSAPSCAESYVSYRTAYSTTTTVCDSKSSGPDKLMEEVNKPKMIQFIRALKRRFNKFIHIPEDKKFTTTKNNGTIRNKIRKRDYIPGEMPNENKMSFEIIEADMKGKHYDDSLELLPDFPRNPPRARTSSSNMPSQYSSYVLPRMNPHATRSTPNLHPKAEKYYVARSDVSVTNFLGEFEFPVVPVTEADLLNKVPAVILRRPVHQKARGDALSFHRPTKDAYPGFMNLHKVVHDAEFIYEDEEKY